MEKMASLGFIGIYKGRYIRSLKTGFEYPKVELDLDSKSNLVSKTKSDIPLMLIYLSVWFQAVRIGDLELFKSVAEKFNSTFSSDRTNNLIVRLRHNVIRTGLRNISISYSRISLVDVAKKLRLDSPNPVADAESIVSKAIRDGAIDATIDHTNGWMVSKETGDIYSTNEPQIAFNSRIAFCLNMHNEAVRALRFPPNSHKEKESAEKRRERQQQEQELAKHIAEEDDDEF